MATTGEMAGFLLHDDRVGCYSFMASLTVEAYLLIAQEAYSSKGGIEGQRTKLATTSGVRIRRRMVQDIIDGTVLPPVVLGMVLSEAHFQQLGEMSYEDIQKFLSRSDGGSISIIDGMQRTTAILDAVEKDRDVLKRIIRVEYWIAKNANSLVYRMLVLNTGQVPWTLKRQIDVVFSPIIKEVERSVDLRRVIRVDDNGRRTNPSEYSSTNIIEMFIAFGLRKNKVESEDHFTDDFSRLDMIDAASHDRYLTEFASVLQKMSDIDSEFSRYKPTDTTAARFKIGRNIFDSQPARVGFITAFSQAIFGRPGFESTEEDKLKNFQLLISGADKFIDRLEAMSDEEMGLFIDLLMLDELIARRKTGKVGDFERDFFLEAFRTLISDSFNVQGMATCWRTY